MRAIGTAIWRDRMVVGETAVASEAQKSRRYSRRHGWCCHDSGGICPSHSVLYSINHSNGRRGIGVRRTGSVDRQVERKQTKRAAVLGDNERPKEELGRLKAIFATENSLTDSLAVLSLAGAFVLGAIWAINWILAGGAPGKLVFLAILLPVAAAFLIFSAVKLYLSHKMFYVYDHGFRYVAGNKSVEHRWTNICQMSAIHLGDAIHEDAIDFMFRNGAKELRITRGNFSSLETIWCRLTQESDEQIQDGKISLIVVAKSE